MAADERLRRYAELAVRVGVNLQPGQHLLVSGLLEHVPLARAIAEVGYENGACYVDVYYSDKHLKRALISRGSEEALTWSPPHLKERLRHVREQQGATISIVGDPTPDLFSDLDPARVGRAEMLELREMQLRAVGDRALSWTAVAFPNEGWAKTIFGEPDVGRLWDAVTRAVRLDDADPVESWRQHVNELDARARALNAWRFDAIRFSGPGTDLSVGLNSGSRWTSPYFETTWGQRHVPNIPTEEVFTTPNFRRVEGLVSSTRPLSIPGDGTVVRDLKIRFEDGRAADVTAARGEEVMRQRLSLDEGAARLGEIALVDRTSAVGKLGLTFLETLFDENATCHVALGAGFAFSVEGAEGLSPEERAELGVNQSRIHIDFMVGGAEVDVDGITKKGEVVPVIRADAWQLEFPA